MSYLKRISTRRPSQSAPIPGSGQVRNSAGGYAWGVDDWTRLPRFLVLGSEGGSYYASELTLTRENAQAVERCLAADGPRTVAEIVRVSHEGRAPKNDPAVSALAMAAGLGDDPTRRSALEALPQVCRTGTHLFQFASFVEGFRGWGRSLRRGVGRWYAAQSPDGLAYQAVKYRQREGVTHRDLLRLAHPAAKVTAGNPTLDVSAEHAGLFEWNVRGGETDGLPRVVEGIVQAQTAESPEDTAVLILEYGLPREAVKSEHLPSADVWEALLEGMPMTALVRNLATMTRVGVVSPGSAGTAKVVAQFGDADRIRRARVHPIAVLAALRTFENVEPAGKRLLIALDVSGSMACGTVAGVPGLTPREASAALALVTAATELRHELVGFFAGKGGFKKRGRRVHAGYTDGLTPLAISQRQRLDDVIKTVVIYADSETWAGDVHPAQALRGYRAASGIDARLIVVGMVSNGFSIADPADPGMLDVVGFDTATPQLITDFARGAV